MSRKHKRDWSRIAGWGRKTRTKVSPYANKGFLYEVRLRAYRVFYYRGFEEHFDDVIERMREMTDARIIVPKVTSKRCRYIRLYLRSEADLMMLRFLTEDVFRTYRLRPPPLPGTERSPAPG